MPSGKTSLYIDRDLKAEIQKYLPGGSSFSGLVATQLQEWLNSQRMRYKIKCTKCNQFFNAELLIRKYDGRCPKCKKIMIEKINLS